MARYLAFRLLLLVGLACLPHDTRAHALDPGYLEVTEIQPDTFRVFWRKPDVNGRPMDIEAVLPERCGQRSGKQPRFDGYAWISQWITTCPAGLAETTLTIEGLERTQTDVLLRVQGQNSVVVNTRLTPDNISWVVPVETSSWMVLGTYFSLGMTHILEGLDHLLFVFALIFLIRNPWRLFGAITAFTVAHSVTLALAALGFVNVSGPPVEAVIALSIVFLAVEIAKSKDGTLRMSERWPWLVSFSFGLLHGLGFAGALSEIGLPESDIVFALLGFNLGVEAGQLVFVAAILALGFVLGRLSLLAGLLDPKNRHVTHLVSSYAIGAGASFWLIDRIVGFWG